MQKGTRIGRPLLVTALEDPHLSKLFPTAQIQRAGGSLTGLARALKAARDRSEGRDRPVIVVVPSSTPHHVLMAVRERAERIVLAFTAAPASPLREASLRAALAFVDLTIAKDPAASRAAVIAGADPDRVACGLESVEARLLSEPVRGRDRTAALEALASMSLDLAHGLGFLGLMERLTPDRGVNVVNYHRVLPVEEHRLYGRPQMALSTPIFEAQLGVMRQRFGFTEIALAHDEAASGSVAVTFDDGYEDNYRVAFPILRAFEVPACIYVATGLVGSEDAAFWDKVASSLFAYWAAGAKHAVPETLPPVCARLEEAQSVSEARQIITTVLSELNAMSPEERERAVLAAQALSDAPPAGRTMLSWREVEEMARHGIQFGSHTKNHVCLDEVSAEVAKAELLEGHEELRQRLPKDLRAPDSVALPRGKLGPFEEEDLRREGFKSVMTTEARVNRPAETGLFVHRRDGKMLTLRGRHHEGKLRLELTGIPDRLRRMLGVVAD